MIFNMIGKGGGGGGVETEGMFCWAKYEREPSLPAGYTKVKNLVSTGTQLIDTEVIPNGNTKVQTTVNYNHTTTGDLFGCRNSWLSGAYGLIHFANTTNEARFLYGSTGVIFTLASGVDNEIETSGTGVKVNGVSVATVANSTTSSSYSIYLFGRHMASTAIAETMKGSIGDTRIYQDGTNITVNLLCCLDADGTPCMYDTVEGKAHYNVGTGVFGTGEVEYVARGILEYAISNNLNAYPQDGYHTDGFYYKLMESELAWDERGQYAWSKNETVYGDDEVSFPTIASATLTATTDGYTLKSGSSGGWGYTYLNSDAIDTTVNAITLKYTIASTGIQKGIFIGVADTKTTTYSGLDHSIYLSTGATNICHWRNGSQINAYETTTSNDVITMKVDGTLMSVYKNDKLIFTDTLSFTNAYVCIILYTGNTVYGVIDCKMANIPSYTPIGYVIGNEEDAYPNDDVADDGYWYQKVGATKVTPKYASGTVNAVAAKVTVTGLGFKPYAVMLQYSTAAIGYGVLDGASGTITAYSKISSNNNTAATFVSNDDGFEFTGANWSTYPFDWYATGY